MHKNITRIECKIGSRSFEFSCDIEASFNEIKEALFQFTKHVGQAEDFAKAQELAKKAEQETQEKNEVVDDIPANN